MEFECGDSYNSNVKSHLKQNKILEQDFESK